MGWIKMHYLENCYNNDVSLKDAGKTLAGIRLISACFIKVQKENKGRNWTDKEDIKVTQGIDKDMYDAI